ncbi:MAG: serine/threonine protein kinase [Planctomycetes bacterium]|nr:serine/threonine protein kinase [Planctomycetota bacterium]
MTSDRENQSKLESAIRSEVSKLVEVHPVTLDMSIERISEVRRQRELLIEEQYAIPEERRQAKALLKGYEHEEEKERRETELRSVSRDSLWLPIQRDNVLSGFLPIPPMKARGGTSEIWVCKSRYADRTLIVKKITLQGQTVDIRPALALRELQTLFNLRHPNIVNVFDAGYLNTNDGEFPYVAMEEVPGITLHEWVHENAPRRCPRIAAFAVSAIADAIQFCHDSGIAHGDLKPDQILINGSEPTKDTIKLIDFGFSIDTNESALGTANGYAEPATVASEQFAMIYRDIFALGGILYFMCTGQHPEPSSGLSKREWQDRLNLIDLGDADLTLICRKCLSYSPADRYSSARQLEEDLGAWLTDYPLQHARKGDYSPMQRKRLLWKRCWKGNDEVSHLELVRDACLVNTACCAIGFIAHLVLTRLGMPINEACDAVGHGLTISHLTVAATFLTVARLQSASVRYYFPLVGLLLGILLTVTWFVPGGFQSLQDPTSMMVAMKYVLLMFGISSVFYASTLKFSWGVTIFGFLPFVLASLVHAFSQSSTMQYIAPAFLWGTEAAFSMLFAMQAGEKASAIERERRFAHTIPDANADDVAGKS